MGKSILKSTAILMVMAFAAKLIGFLRSAVIAYVFGATAGTDEYYLANVLISNIVFALMTALSVSFLPLYIDKLNRLGRERAAKYASKVTGILLVIAAAISLAVFAGAPLLAKISAPTYTPERHAQIAEYFRILSAGIIFMMLTRLLGSILNAEKIYGYNAVSGIVFSVTEILFVIFLSGMLGIKAVVIAVPVAYIIQYIVLRLRLSRTVELKPNFQWKDPAIKTLLLTAVPVLLSNSTLEINHLVDRLLASTQVEGGVSALSYAAVLFIFVASLITESINTVVFTEISERASRDDTKGIKELFTKGVSYVTVILLPITIIVVEYAYDVVNIVYGRGRFTQDAVVLTASVLAVYSTYYIANAVKGLSTRVFYSGGNTKTPMMVGVIAVVINISVSILLVKLIGFIGIAVGTAISAWTSMILQIYFLRKRYGAFQTGEMLKSLMKTAAAGAMMCVVTMGISFIMKGMSSYIRFTLATIVGFAVYFAALSLMKSNETKIFYSAIKRKLFKKHSV